MKNYSREKLMASRPKDEALTCVNFCLDRLVEDTTREPGDEVVAGLTFEELIGGLLKSKDELEYWESRKD